MRRENPDGLDMEVLREMLTSKIGRGAGPEGDDILSDDPIERQECR
jgi:hypothetical protein